MQFCKSYYSSIAPVPYSNVAFPVSVRGLWRFLPDVNPTGISALTALTEVSHPAVVSKTTDGDDMKALATLGTLVDFEMFVESRARFATLITRREAAKSESTKKERVWMKESLICQVFPHSWAHFA